MKSTNLFRIGAACLVFSLFSTSCNSPTAKATPASEEVMGVSEPDMEAIKIEIQSLEDAWADADNARDVEAMAALIADDAVSMPNNRPMIKGKAAIVKDMEEYLSKRTEGITTAYDVLEVVGDEKTVTEIGTTTRTDASGNVVYSGKYIVVWEKRDGKFLAIYDIGNDDSETKY